jgi:hypothetical protein
MANRFELLRLRRKVGILSGAGNIAAWPWPHYGDCQMGRSGRAIIHIRPNGVSCGALTPC